MTIRDYLTVDRRVSLDHPECLRPGDVIEWPGIEVTERDLAPSEYDKLRADWLAYVRRNSGAAHVWSPLDVPNGGEPK